MKKYQKIVLYVVLIAMVLGIVFITFSSNVYAANTAITTGELENQAKAFLNKGSTGASGVQLSNSLKQLQGFGQILTTVGAGILVGVTAYMGIKYITATPETQGKLKQQLIGLVVAAFVIFGSYTIWSIVLNIVAMFDE